MARLTVIADFRLVRDQVSATGFLTAEEGYALLLLAQHGPGNGSVVEIGSFLGRSTCFLALGAFRGGKQPVTAVDHFGGSPEHQVGQPHESEVLKAEGTTFGQFLRNLRQAGVFDHVRPIRASSIEAASHWSEPIRLLFIDGDHSYEASRADFEAWSPFVEEEGLIAFHDVDQWAGVTRFYAELLEAGTWRECAKVMSLRVVRRAGSVA
jgi:predicted O-methyltransferase YrrM